MSDLKPYRQGGPLSLPNILTFSRIAIIPLIIGLLFLDSALARWSAFGLYVAASLTDWLDGRLARARGEVSSLGRFLDPVADKLLVTAIIVMLVAARDLAGLQVIPAIVILCREILVSGLREYLAELQVPLPVSQLAKWKTAIQMIAIGLLLPGASLGAALPLAGLLLFWLAALLSILSGWNYLSRGLQYMWER